MGLSLSMVLVQGCIGCVFKQKLGSAADPLKKKKLLHVNRSDLLAFLLLNTLLVTLYTYKGTFKQAHRNTSSPKQNFNMY